MFAIGGAALIVVLAAGWFLLSSMADQRAEKSIDDFLIEHDLRDQVHWKSLSASPFGSARLDDVTLSVGGENMRIARVEIADFADDPDHKSADLRLSGIATSDNRSPLAQITYLRAAGRADLPPATLRLGYDFDRHDDTVALKITITQPQAIEATLDLQLERVGSLIRLADAAQAGGSPLTAAGKSPNPFAAFGLPGGPARAAQPRFGGDFAGGNPFDADAFGAFAMVLGMLDTVGDVQIRRIDLALRDDGYVKRSIALQKRYAIPVSAAEGDAGSQRDKSFQLMVDAARTDCDKNLPLGGARERHDACGAVLDFVSARKKTLSLRLRPEHPVPLSTLIRTGMENPQRIAPMLRPEIGS